MIDFGIISAPRPKAYIGESLTSFFETWNVRPHVFLEPGCSSFLNETKVEKHFNENTLGCVRNWLNAARWMLDHTESIFVGMLEDDIEWRDDSYNKISNLLKILSGKIVNNVVQSNLPLQKIGFISPYCSVINGPTKKGWQKPILYGGRAKRKGLCGALCVIMPRNSLKLLLDHEDYFLERSSYNSGGRPRDLDYAISETFSELGLMALTHNPTLVTHIGEISTHEGNNRAWVNNQPERQPLL